MKRVLLLFMAGAIYLLSSCEQKKIIRLFNEKNLSGWGFELATDSISAKQVFSVKKKNKIHITGNPFGYMYTQKEYQNYRLHVEWRWIGDPSISGILLHAQPLETFWRGLPFPNAIECQLKAGNAGDIVLLGNSYLDEISEETIIKEKLHPSNEKPAGEWNHADIICRGDAISIYINGLLQNTAKGAIFTKGHICLQSEGGPIEFRNIRLAPLKKHQRNPNKMSGPKNRKAERLNN